MEISVEKVREYLLALKETGKFTTEDIANISGIPQQTVRNILTGKTPDARLGTIAKIVFAMGGDLNALVGYETKKEIEVNSAVSLKETYEMRLSDLSQSYEARIEDIKALCEMRINDIVRCCESRIADMRKNYEERLEEQRDILSHKRAQHSA